ncbi:MAG: arginase [Nitrospinae bacterium RIFCSPLOWO2_12_39_16]|nr:MAG: arginase [Nitrospinae bacterium RIFCSPLOWO2_12_39_16]HLA48577.1 arginase [Nitrospinota bacterium]
MSKKIKIIGVPIDLGFGRRGVDMGPSALRITGIADSLRGLDYSVEDIGDIKSPIPELCNLEDKNARYLPEIKDICIRLSNTVYTVLQEGAVPLSIGGDHSLAIGSIAGVSRFLREKSKKAGLIWFDAHGDMNTPESTNSGNIHGMPLAVSLGLGAKALTEIEAFSPKIESKNAVLIGVRNLDEREKGLIVNSGIKVYTMKEIDENGMSNIIRKAIDLAARDTDYIHLSFDMDVCDPSIAQGVGTPVKGGLNYREAHLAMEKIAESGMLASMDMVEINPILDYKNLTADLGAELILSAFGKRIFY